MMHGANVTLAVARLDNGTTVGPLWIVANPTFKALVLVYKIREKLGNVLKSFSLYVKYRRSRLPRKIQNRSVCQNVHLAGHFGLLCFLYFHVGVEISQGFSWG